MALIIDAPMPKNCLSCPSKEHCLAFGKVHFNERLKMLDKCIRADNCPIIGEIPDKYGRLIDADVFWKRLQKQTMLLWTEKSKEYQYFLDVMDMIKSAPTVVEATE